MTAGNRAILVTGGCGYIGSHAVLTLREHGYSCVVIDDLSTGVRALLPKGVPLIVGDCGDRQLVAHTLREHAIEAVLHFAGSISVPESVADPIKYFRNNTRASLHLIEACIAAGVNDFVFSSTAAVYGIPARSPVCETKLLAPINPYGASKAMTERILTDISAAFPEFRAVILRYFNVAGADAQCRAGQAGPNATHLIRVAMEVVTGKRQHLEIFGTDYPTPDGTCIRDYIHVSDLVEAHVLALQYLFAGGASEIFNCGYGRGASVKEIVSAVERLTGAPLPVRFGPRRAGDPPALVADSTKIRSALKWTPRFDDLTIILKTALAWERKLSKSPF
jgi:UDP-glucose 4-epimerase